MAEETRSSSGSGNLVRTTSCQPPLSVRAESPRRFIYHSGSRSATKKLADDSVINQVLLNATINNDVLTNAAGKLYETETKETGVYKLVKKPTISADNVVIRRGLSDNICSINNRANLKLVRNNSTRVPKFTPADRQPTEYGHVYLNIYDLESVNKVVNVVAGTFGAGAYHAGVEIYGYEYNFGYTSLGGTGVMQSFPRFHSSHVYRKTLDLGKTKYSPREVTEIIDRLKSQWPGKGYDILKRLVAEGSDLIEYSFASFHETHHGNGRNCLNFADTLCKELGVGGIPSWVMGLQNKINWTRASINSGAAKLKQFDETVGISRAIGSLQRKLTGNCTRPASEE